MKKNNKKGFTLVELVIVVAVMAILVAVAIPTVKSVTNSAKTAVQETNARTIEATIKLYEANKEAGTVGAPTTLEDAMDKAALGIKDAVYSYDVANGVAKYEGTNAEAANWSGTATKYILKYDGNGACTTSGEPAANAGGNNGGTNQQ